MNNYHIAQPSKPFTKAYLHCKHDNTLKLTKLSGKLHVKYASKKLTHLELKIDPKKSDEKFINVLQEIQNYLNDKFDKDSQFYIKDVNYDKFITEYSTENISLKLPYKIKITDFITLSNFDIYISLNIYVMKTYAGYVQVTKTTNITIPYNYNIYSQYGILENMKKNIITNDQVKIKKYGEKKSDIVENIMNILNTNLHLHSNSLNFNSNSLNFN